MKRLFLIFLILFVSYNLNFSQERIQPKSPGITETILPLELLIEIINETSGEQAFQNEIILTGVNRNREPEEYKNGYFESSFVEKKLKEYGLKDVSIVELPKSFFSRQETTWDAISAELWMVKPQKIKLADLREIPATLCSGSYSFDGEGELIYVGPGDDDRYYKDKDVKEKFILVNGSPEPARRVGVEKFGALGIIAYSSSHPEFDPDQVGWNSIRITGKDKKTFAFMVSTRKGNELRDLLERGQKIFLKASSKTQFVPYREECITALIKGDERPNEELIFTAHVFEGFAKQGANDDASGCVALMETARVLQKLKNSGKIKLKRSVRFLFVPEISGTLSFLQKFPDIKNKIYANINEDMVGEALIKNNSIFQMKSTPHSLPSYLNDVIADIIEWVGEANRINLKKTPPLPIYAPTGTRDPFYYAIDPYDGGSDHIVFVDGGVKIPAVMLICWPDMWYHTDRDTPDKSDPTQLKRVVVISVASAVFLSNAEGKDVIEILNLTSSKGMKRIGEDKVKAWRLLKDAEIKEIHRNYKEAINIIKQGIEREREAIKSIEFFIGSDSELKKMLLKNLENLKIIEKNILLELQYFYNYLSKKYSVKPMPLKLSKEDIEASKLVPVRTEKMKGFFNSFEFREFLRERKDLPKYNLGPAEFEVRNFIDGKRSVLDIRNAVSAEYYPFEIKDVLNYLKILEEAGFIKIEKRK
ncbi:MAG: M28 family peptidase [Candidatus Aminicenantia bacterium]